MPTLTPSAPRSIRAWVASAVTTFPATTSISGNHSLIFARASNTPWACPWAESRASISTPASASAWARSCRSGPVPTAAPTLSRRRSSSQASGCWMRLVMSLTVMSPCRTPSSSTTSSFSILWRCRISLASSNVVPVGTVTRFSLVINSWIGRSRFSSNRRSRFVRMPTNRLPSSVMGMPEMW